MTTRTRRRPRLHRLDRHPGPRGRRAHTPTASDRRRSAPAATSTCSRGRPSQLRVPLVAAARGDADEVRAALAQAAARRPASRHTRPSCWSAPDATTVAAGCGADVVLNGITGSIGLRPTLAALRPGRRSRSPTRSRSSSAGRSSRPPRRPARSCRSTASTRPSPSACAADAREEVRRLVVTASGGPFRGRTRAELADVTPRAGAGPPQLRDGPGHHDELGDPGQQGPRGHRGAPALRHPVRADRRRGAPAADDPLDGRVPRRLDDRPGSARRGCSCRSRWGWPGPSGSPDADVPCDWTQAQTWEFEPLDDEAFPAVRLARQVGRPVAPTRRSTTPPTRCASTRSTTADRLPRHRRHRGARGRRARRPRARPRPALDGRARADAWARAEAARLASRCAGPRERCRRSVARTAGHGIDVHGTPCMLAFLLGVLVVAVGVGCVDRPARDRPPGAGQEVRREGDPVHGRLRADDLVAPPRRDRVRRQGDPARRLHPDDRHVPAAPGRQARHAARLEHRPVQPARSTRRGRPAWRRSSPGDERPRLLQADRAQEGHRHARRPGHEPAHRASCSSPASSPSTACPPTSPAAVVSAVRRSACVRRDRAATRPPHRPARRPARTRPGSSRATASSRSPGSRSTTLGRGAGSSGRNVDEPMTIVSSATASSSTVIASPVRDLVPVSTTTGQPITNADGTARPPSGRLPRHPVAPPETSCRSRSPRCPGSSGAS